MARGWESKAVEDQIAAAEARKGDSRPARAAEEIERDVRRQGLLLSRAKILHDIEHARDSRHRAALHQALEHIDEQIKVL